MMLKKALNAVSSFALQKGVTPLDAIAETWVNPDSLRMLINQATEANDTNSVVF